MWNVKLLGMFKHNVTMQTTAEFASNSTANIKLSKHPSFLLLTSNKFITKSKNAAAKKLCCGVVALKIPRKLSCNGWFCNVGGCKTQISIELGCFSERFTWKVEREQCGKRDFQLRDPVVATRSDHIREHVVQTPWSIFISKNDQNDISKWPDIKDDNLRCQVVCCYSVLKTSVSFRYQLKRLCDVLSWSVSLRCQLVRC